MSAVLATLMSTYKVSKKELCEEWTLPQWILMYNRSLWLLKGVEMPSKKPSKSAKEIKEEIQKVKAKYGK